MIVSYKYSFCEKLNNVIKCMLIQYILLQEIVNNAELQLKLEQEYGLYLYVDRCLF